MEKIFRRSSRLIDLESPYIPGLSTTEEIRISLLCVNCQHWKGWTDAGYCRAFTDDPIPDEIYDGDFDHRQEFPGDNGLTWAPRAEAPELDPEDLMVGGTT